MAEKWRNITAMRRASLVRSVARRYLQGQNREYDIGKPIKNPFPVNRLSINYNAGMLITYKHKPIGAIRVNDIGKPKIHVSSDYKNIARDLAKEIKRRFSFWFKPPVRVIDRMSQSDAITVLCRKTLGGTAEPKIREE
jgi:hypothetical protein